MEKYLSKCLYSLIVPNLDDVEVLVINDGSKDSSSKIGHEYQDKYPKSFRIIDKENGNYGSCINRGLKEATGKYVKVLDADDSFNGSNFPPFIELLKTIDVDLVLSDFCIVDGQDKLISDEVIYLRDGEILPFSEAFRGIVKQLLNMHSVTYRRSIFDNIDYFQTEGISYTDQEWVFVPMLQVQTVFYYKQQIYRYLVGRSGQTMDNVVSNIGKLMTVIFHLSQVYDGYSVTCEPQMVAYNEYMKNQLSAQLNYIYTEGIVHRSYKISQLKDFDNRLNQFCPSTYEIIKHFKMYKMPYSTMWKYCGLTSWLFYFIWRVKNMIS
jgi:glycosyltransferase involved in cell wall biosynthesis